METHEKQAEAAAFQQFVETNLMFLQNHRESLARLLNSASGIASGVTAPLTVSLDDDLMIAFNDVAGENLQAQMVIQQIQTNRYLSKLIQQLETKDQVAVEPDTEEEEK